MARVAVILTCILTALGPASSQWLNPCQDTGSTFTFRLVANGPSSNNPNARFDRNACSIFVQPCTISSCAGNVPGVQIDLTLTYDFDAIQGYMIEVGDTRSNSADDCNTDHGGGIPHSAWNQRQGGHGGVSVFGTPERVIYGGCGPGTNFGTYNYTIRPQVIQPTRVIRFESHQSVRDEVVFFRLGGIRVRPLVTRSPTSPSPTPAPTLHATTISLQNDVSTLQATQSSLAQSLSNAQSTIENQASVIEFLIGQEGSEAGLWDQVRALRSDLDSQITAAESNIEEQSNARSQALASLPQTDTFAPNSCGSSSCRPAVQADQDGNLRLQAHDGDITLEARCGNVDPCDLHDDVEQLKAALRSLL